MKVFLNIADRLEADILRGAYLPGNRLPSVRLLAEKMEVSQGTVQNTLRYLKDKRLVTVKRTRGYFVVEDEAYIRKMRQKKENGLAQNLFSSLHSLGMTDKEIAELMDREQKSRKNRYR